jgi:LuxR family maltose regulon positive regulatory protein
MMAERGKICMVAYMGSVNVSLTKIVVPARRPEILSRERLLNLLYDLVDKKLVLLSAPAGYGKTSLLIDLAHNVDMKLCWLSLDALDQEPQRFMAYFIASIAQRFPRFGNRSLSSLNNLTSLDQGFENLVVTLVNEIYERIGEHFLIVLDDYQFVDDIPPIREFVNRFIQLVGENCHLILSSRTVPALPDMLLMIARNQVSGLSLLELAFQPKEVRTLFQKNYDISLSEDAAAELAKQTEGWITGLYLSRWVASDSMPDPVRAARAINVDVFDYLGQQVLDRQPAKLRNFLLQTSLLDEFDAELCAAIFDEPSSSKTVQQNNLFILPVGPDGKWLRYHHLFRDFLQLRMREENPARADAILRRAAQVYAQRGEWEKAYHIFEQSGDSNALIALVEEAGTFLIQSDRFITLGNWLDNIPDTLVRDRPVLLSLKGTLALIRGKPENGLPLLSQAESAFRSAKDLPNLALNLARMAWAQRLLGDYAASLAAADEVLQITSGNEELQSLRAEAQRAKGLSLFRLGQARQAIEWLEYALALFSDQNKTRDVSMVETELGMAYRAIGDYSIAGRYYEQALAALRKEGDLTGQATLLNSLGVLYHAQGEYERAVSTFEQGLDCARRSGFVDTEAWILTSMGDLYTEISELEIAQKTYEQADLIAHRVSDRFLINYLALALAGLARMSRIPDRAYGLLEEVQPSIKASSSNYEHGLYYFESGRLHLTTGNTQQAIWDLQSSIEYFTLGRLVMEHAWARLWFAAACKEVGDQAAACLHIKEGLALVNPSQPSHSLKMTLLQIRRWVGDLREDRNAGPEFARLLSQAEQVESKLPALRKQLRRLASVVPMPPPRLTIQALGKAQVKINGKPVTGSQWQTQSVRDLFFYFFVTAKPVTKEQVGAAFWPDISSAQLKLRFKNNIYRLRRAVGQDTILFDEELYHFNNDLDYEYDVDIFEMELAQAKTAHDLAQQISHYRAAVELVQGLYLEDIDAAWAWPERERIEQQYLSALLRLAKLLSQSGKNEEALQFCQRALARDACLEDAHQMAMQIYAAMKERSAVIRQYQLCQKTLEEELGASPSPETEEIYRQSIG